MMEGTVVRARPPRNGVTAIGRSMRKVKERGATFWGPACINGHIDPLHGKTLRYVHGNFACVQCVLTARAKVQAAEEAKRGDPERTPEGCWYPPEEWLARNVAALRRSHDPMAYLRGVAMVIGQDIADQLERLCSPE
jgi:hypothetical protein